MRRVGQPLMISAAVQRSLTQPGSRMVNYMRVFTFQRQNRIQSIKSNVSKLILHYYKPIFISPLLLRSMMIIKNICYRIIATFCAWLKVPFSSIKCTLWSPQLTERISTTETIFRSVWFLKDIVDVKTCALMMSRGREGGSEA